MKTHFVCDQRPPVLQGDHSVCRNRQPALISQLTKCRSQISENKQLLFSTMLGSMLITLRVSAAVSLDHKWKRLQCLLIHKYIVM